MGWIVSKCSKGFFIDQQMWHQAAPASALEGAIIRSATQLWSLLQIPGVLGKSRLHAGEDLVHLVRRVHVPIAVLLAVQHSAPNNLHLQVAGCVRSALPCHLHLVSKLGLKFLLDLAELGRVPSSAAIDDVYLDRHDCREATAVGGIACPGWSRLEVRWLRLEFCTLLLYTYPVGLVCTSSLWTCLCTFALFESKCIMRKM